MSINRWMDKEVVVHTYSEIVLSYKMEHIWVSSNEVDEPRAYYAEWSKWEREKQISYINTYIWNLEKMVAGQQWWHRFKEQTCGHSWGRRGWENIYDVGGRREALRPWQRSWGRRLDIRKGGIEPQESPWKSSSIYPHNQSLPTLLLCALTYTSDFTGGCPPPPLLEKELT